MYKEKFKILLHNEKKYPGLMLGLDILRKMNEEKNDIVLSSKGGKFVEFYDFVDDKVYNYDIISLNFKLQEVYKTCIVYEKILLYNRLYWMFCGIYKSLYEKHNYGYYKSTYNMHDFFSRFVQGMRKSFVRGDDSFSVKIIAQNFGQPFFDEKVSRDQLYMFIADFLFALQEEKVLIYDFLNGYIKFEKEYKKDSIILFNSSFDMFVLGENYVYSSFDLSEDDINIHISRIDSLYSNLNKEALVYINDMMTSFAICCSVNNICYADNTNNILIQTMKEGLPYYFKLNLNGVFSR